MRKMWLLGLTSLALVACTNDEIVELNESEIKLSVLTENQTRAADVYCNNNLMDDFLLMASKYSTENTRTDAVEYIDPTTITVTAANNVSFPTGEVFYWPQSGYLDFYAAKNGQINWNDKTKVPQIMNFSPDGDVKKQVDLLYAAATGKQKTTSGNTPVTLNFRHALSQIVFMAKNTNDNITVAIKGVSVCNVNNMGTFTYPADFASTDANVVDHTQSSTDVAITSASQGTWNFDGSTKIDYKITLDKEVNVTSDAVALTSYTDEKNVSNALLMLPTSDNGYDAWNPTTYTQPSSEKSTGFYFLINCTIKHSKVNSNTAPNSYIWGNATTYKDIAIPYAPKWEQGKKYTYTFVFSDNGDGGFDPENGEPVLVPIKLAVTVDDFIKGDAEDVEMNTTTDAEDDTPAA